MPEHDLRKRSGATLTTELQEQIVNAIQAGLESYQAKRNTVDIRMFERLSQDVRDGFEKVNGRLDVMDSKFGQGTGRFAVLETKSARAEKDIEELKRVATTERLLAVQNPEKESKSDEAPVVSNKFKNAIWLGLAGSIGAGLMVLAGMAFKATDPPQNAPVTTSPPVTPASPRAAIPQNPPAPAAP